jgi:hypothetical protein
MYKNKYFTRWRVISCVFALALLAQAIVPILLPRASAAGVMTNTIVRFDRMKQSTGGAGDVFTTGTVCAKPASTGTEADVKVTFPAGMTVSGTTSNWNVNTTPTTGWPTTSTAWLGIGTATAVVGQNVTFPSSDLTVGTLYCFNWANSTTALKTNTAIASNQTGTVTTEATGPTTIDTGNYATATLSNDQIAVSASVGSTFSFSLSGNTATLPALTSVNPVSATAINATVSTNATKGWNMWAADAGGTIGLRSANALKTIPYSPAVNVAAAALTANNEGYNIGAGTAGTGTCTGVVDDGNFASSGTSYKGGGLDATLRSLAVSTGVADNCQLPLTVNASISSTTPPATDYTGTITVVAAGNF